MAYKTNILHLPKKNVGVFIRYKYTVYNIHIYIYIIIIYYVETYNISGSSEVDYNPTSQPLLPPFTAMFQNLRFAG